MKTIAIQENQSYAQSLIKASLDPLVTISLEGKITDVNEALSKVMGIMRDKLIGTDFSQHFTEPEKAREGYKLVFKKGFVLEYPLAIRHKNGKLTHVLCNAAVYKDAQDFVPGVVVAVRDIRQSKRTSKYALSLFEASLDPLFTISPEGKITDVNEAAVKVTGVTCEKLIGADFADYFTKPQKAREVYQKVFAKGSVADCPLTLRHENGKLTDVLFNGSVYNDDRGNVLGVVIVARDVTAHDELIIAKKELVFQNAEKEKRADELIIANKELAFQDKEKEKRAGELIIANKELAFQDKEKEKRAEELIIANKELVFQNEEKEKRAAELIIANKELVFQNEEKEKRAEELIIANKELAFQNEEKEKRAEELIIANKELAFQNDEKEKRAEELIIANKELAFQNEEKEKRAEELIIANKELLFQNEEKEKRAAELFIANKELVFQTGEKEKRAAELVVADIELDFQNKEKEKREIANKELEAFSYSVKLASQYSLSLIEASRDPLVTISTEGKITDMNQATVNIIGMSREQLTGTDFFDYFTEQQKAREVYQEVFAKGSVADSPLTLRHKNGKLTDVLFNGSVYKDDRGNVLGVVIVARDVTAQKLLSKYSLSLIEASLDPLVTISTEGKITDMNEATVNITGITREKLTGTDFFDYFTEPQKAREVYQEVFAKGSVADSPLTLRHKNGKLTDVLFNGSVYKDDRGNVLGVVIVARDVTAQKLQEVKINTLNEELEQRIIELESFSYSVSHDLRAPLRGVDGFIAMFLNKYLDKVDDEGQRLLGNVRRNVTRMGSLIDELLTLSRIGMKDIQITSINMKELAYTTLEELSEMKGEAKVTVGEIATAKGDTVLIKQVLVNLVSNALKYSNKKEHPQIEIGCEPNGTDVHFYVKDNGVGFDMEYSNKLFGVFQRLHDPQEYQGTGVGLAIVKRIITRHGGKVWAEGKENEGAIFYFSLKKE